MGEYTVSDSGCWVWPRTGKNGYGILRVGRTIKSAHREFYIRAKGPIPAGMVLDHLCRVRACVNPDHLEAVTQRTNALRGLKTVLSTADATAVRQAMRHERTEEVARRFGISESCALDIATGRRRLDAHGAPAVRVSFRYRRKSRVGREEVAVIRSMRKSGTPLRDVAARFGISVSYACMIATGALDRRYGA